MHEVCTAEVVCDAKAMPRGCKLSTPRVLNLVSRHLIHEVPGRCARWRLGRFVFINQQNTGYEPKRRNSSIYIPSSRLHLDSHFLPYWTHRKQLNTPPAIIHSASILKYLDITWVAQNNTSRSQIHLITYTTLYVHSGLPSSMLNCIIMLTIRIWIHFQLAAMTPNGSRKGEGNATAKAKKPTRLIIDACRWIGTV